MSVRLPAGFDRSNAVVAAAVWLFIVVMYGLTKAPTLSFWDCGEFIAASYILGLPHPPGTPAYILLGRIFSMIPFQEDIATRVNFLSALCSSIAALFGYLVGVRVMRFWFKDRSLITRVITYGAAASGTLFLAFGRTQWNNSVEAEVYGMSMMLFMMILWLALVYLDNHGRAHGDRWLLAIVYLAFLGIGVHMTTFLVFPVVAVALLLKPKTPQRIWMLVAAYFIFELYLIFALSSKPNEVPYYVPIIIVAIFYVFYALSFEKTPREILILGGGLVIACLPVVSAFGSDAGPIVRILGIAALVGASGYALLLLIRAKKSRMLRDPAGEADSRGATSTAAWLVLAADVMVLILISPIRGYEAFLFLSILAAAAMVLMIWDHIRWPILIAILGVVLVIVGIREYFFGSLAAVAVILLFGKLTKWQDWRTAVLVVVMAALGFSVHIFVPIRSSLHPYINENNPSRSLESTINFLERKQYGSQGMVERMFERRGEWENQFGNFARMGFWGFFSEQYGLGGPRFLVLLVLGAFGLWEACRRKPEIGSLLLILVFVATVGLILYMNFADGMRRDPVTGGDYLEVRDRDYFFTPGFMLYGLMVGLGIGGLIQYIRDMVQRFTPALRSVCISASFVLMLLPAYALANNYHVCDRTNNYIPYDYAYNLLISADENAVLFTSGDNDTFPLWCLQEVYGVRKDVRNVNLSLANTDWYIRQIRDYMGLKITWTDDQIDSLRAFRIPDGRTFRIQDQVIDEIVANNWGEVPINFSITCSSGSRKLQGRTIDTLLELRGMTYRLTDQALGLRVNIDVSRDFLMGDSGYQYSFQHWNDSGVYMDETTDRLVQNTASFIMYTVDALEARGRIDEAAAATRYLADRIPMPSKFVEKLANYYAEDGDIERLEELMLTHGSIDSLGFMTYMARAYIVKGDAERGEALLLTILKDYPDYRPALDELMAQYFSTQDVEGMLSVLSAWVENNPEDKDIREALERLVDQLQRRTPATKESP